MADEPSAVKQRRPLAQALAGLAFLLVGGAAAADDPPCDCAHYRYAPLVEREFDLTFRAEDAVDGPKISLYFFEDYKNPPFVWCIDTPCRAATFQFDPKTGRPVPYLLDYRLDQPKVQDKKEVVLTVKTKKRRYTFAPQLWFRLNGEYHSVRSGIYIGPDPNSQNLLSDHRVLTYISRKLIPTGRTLGGMEGVTIKRPE